MKNIEVLEKEKSYLPRTTMVNMLDLSWHGSQCSLSLAVTVRSRNLMSKLLIADVAGNDAFLGIKRWVARWETW
jgi:hypothetical protein